MKSIDENGVGFTYLKHKLPKVSEAKIKEGICIGPPTTELIKYLEFQQQLSSIEKIAWNAIKNVFEHFLGNIMAENYRDLVAKLIKSFQIMSCNMNFRITFSTHTMTYFSTKPRHCY